MAMKEPRPTSSCRIRPKNQREAVLIADVTPTRIAEPRIDRGRVGQRTSVTERTDGVEDKGTALRALCHSFAVPSTPTPSAAVGVSLH